MPQPIRPPSQNGKAGPAIHSGPNVILHRPALAAQIGNIISNWTLVETDLLNLYSLMMGDYLTTPEGDPGQIPPSHPVAFQIFEQIQSFNARLDLVESLCKWRGTQDEISQFSQSLRKQIKKAHNSRNSVAHDGWGVCDAYPDALIMSRIYGHPLIYKMRDFEEISLAICDAHAALVAFFFAMYERRIERA